MQGGMAGAVPGSVEGGTSKEPAGLTSVSPWVSRQSEHRPLKKRCNPKRAGKAGAQFFRKYVADASGESRFRATGGGFRHFARSMAPPSEPLPAAHLPKHATCVCVRAVTLYGAQRQRMLRSGAPSHRTTDSEYAAWIDVPAAATPGTSIALGAVGLTGNKYGPIHITRRCLPRDGF
jgi:hypothetical protein